MPDALHTAETPMTTSGGEEKLEDSIALCLSGGGYRAMLYHLGTLWYLSDVGYLAKLARISSVSGGSITSGTLAVNWAKATASAQGFKDNLVTPIRRMASTTI